MNRASYHSRDETSPEAIFRRFCRLPNDMVSDEQAERLAHRDLERLDVPALRQELNALRQWLPLQRLAHPWFRERIRRLEVELRGRQ